MKISNIGANNSFSELAENKGASTPVQNPASASTDQIAVGNVATAASKALETSNQRVEELRRKYLDGTYNVDATALSSKIVSDHIES